LKDIVQAYDLHFNEVGFSVYRELGFLTIQATKRLLEHYFVRYSTSGSVSRHFIRIILVKDNYVGLEIGLVAYQVPCHRT
jgi:hypothetical protein